MGFFLEAVMQGLIVGALYALITMGLAVLHSVSGVLNFAHGNFVVLAMFLCLVLQRRWNIDPYLAGVVVIPVMFLVGVLLYRLVFAKLTTAPVLTVIQATLGLVFVVQAGLLMVFGGQFRRVSSVVDDHNVSIGSVRVSVGDLVAFVGALALTAGLFLLLERSAFGRSVRGVQQNPRAARLVGINIETVRLISFGLGLAMAAAAGVLLLPGTSIHPSQGLTYTVVAIMAFFIGGMGSYLGTFLGAMTLGISESLGAVYLPGAIGFALPYLIVVLVIVVRPRGLFALQVAA